MQVDPYPGEYEVAYLKKNEDKVSVSTARNVHNTLVIKYRGKPIAIKNEIIQ